MKRRGFTLVELLVVIAIIGVLVALLLPAVQAAREAARRAQCSNNMKQLGLAAHTYHDVYLGLPMGNFKGANFPGGTAGAKGTIGWPVPLLPFMEEDNLYNQIDQTQPAYTSEQNDRSGWDGSGPSSEVANLAPSQQMPAGFVCPSAARLQWSDKEFKDYAMNGGTGCCPERGHERQGLARLNTSYRFRDITDGTANTFLFLEREHIGPGGGGDAAFDPGPINPFFWVNHYSQGMVMRENGINGTSRRGAGGPHPGGIMVTMSDASVRFASETTALSIYGATLTRNGGETNTIE